jgi:hypothetical protein
MEYYIEIIDHSPRNISKPGEVTINYEYEGERAEPAIINFTVTPSGTCTFKENNKDQLEVAVALKFSAQQGSVTLLITEEFDASNVFVTAELFVNNTLKDKHGNYNIVI